MKSSRKSNYINFISVVLLVGVAVLLGECSNASQDQDITYKSEKYGISVNIPKEFADANEIKEDLGGIYFINKEIQEDNPENILGVVGRIEIYDKKDFTKENMKEKEDIYSLRFLGENENYYFGWAHATDVQIPPNASEQLKDKFSAMEAEFDEIIKTIIINEAVYEQQNEEKIISFVIDLDVKTRMMIFDKIEWLNETDDLDRINELGLDVEEFPNGYYIYNEIEEKISLKLADNVKIYIVNFDDLTNPKETDLDGLSQHVAEYEELYQLTIKAGQIVEIFEQYRP